MKIISWTAIRALGNNRKVQSANIWAFIVPITAKVAHELQEFVHINIFGQDFCVNLGLPFSWKILFVASVAFFIANLFYMISCPPIIKETNNYKDFQDQGRSLSELAKLFELTQVQQCFNEDVQIMWRNWLAERIPYTRQYQTTIHPDGREDRTIGELYSEVVGALNLSRTLLRILTSSLYTIGIISLGILLWQNITYVAMQW